MHEERTAIARMQWMIIVVVILVAGVAGVLVLNQGETSGTAVVYLSIVESDPLKQTDSFNPANITLAHGTTVTLAIQNGDDQARTFQITAFNINETIASGSAERVTLTVGQAGTYEMYVPAASAASAANHRASPAVLGYLIAT